MLALGPLDDINAARTPPAEFAGAAFIRHGGNLSAATLRFPAAPRPWLDLSTGISPHAYPIGPLTSDVWACLPDPSGLTALEQAAARCYGARPMTGIVAGPGTQAIIQLLPRLLPAQRVAVLGFGYQEHPAVWRAAGAIVTIVQSLEDLRSADLAVVVNPNNPDGRIVNPADLADVARQMARRGGTLVVDEAFIDVMPPATSLVPMLPEGAVVLRSFGKMFGLAGLRLGFALMSPELAARLRASLGPWAVSGPAVAIGTRALADTQWLQTTKRVLEANAARLDTLLEEAGFSLVGGTPLFRLVERADAAIQFERLGRAGILVRPFDSHPTWLRFGLPADADAWLRLSAALHP